MEVIHNRGRNRDARTGAMGPALLQLKGITTEIGCLSVKPLPNTQRRRGLRPADLRPGHGWATSHERSWLPAVTHKHSPSVASKNVAPGRQDPAPPTFQAGHEGSIPFARSFARSSVNPQVSTLSPARSATVTTLYPAAVPAACPIVALSGASDAPGPGPDRAQRRSPHHVRVLRAGRSTRPASWTGASARPLP